MSLINNFLIIYLFILICGSDWDSLCTKYTVSHASLDWSSHHWFKHSLTFWPAEIRGILFII